VKSYLDIREINGYSLQRTDFFSVVPPNEVADDDGTKEAAAVQPVIDCLVYIGLPTNPQFVGPQHPDALARHILQSSGPSGLNKEYLYMLEASLVDLSPESEDRHVMDLASRCRALEATETTEHNTSVREAKTRHRSVGSIEEQEEVEK